MKIRNGYVSNSSSSSFLVIYDKESDFIKFKDFNGYDTFINDLKKFKEYGERFIENYLHNYWYNIHNQYMYEDLDITKFFDKQENIELLIETAKVDDTEYQDFMETVHKEGFDFHNANKGNINYKNPEYRKYEKLYFENKEAKCFLKDFAKKIYQGLLRENYIISCVRYEDQTEDGAYMERGFMPFIAMNPEQNYLIIACSEH
jgi:hypothetical protein